VYTLILMTAMATSTETPSFFFRHAACHGYFYVGCHGYAHSHRFGCYGACDGYYFRSHCYGCYGGAVLRLPRLMLRLHRLHLRLVHGARLRGLLRRWLLRLRPGRAE
jgi:hypothetical protein